MMPTRQTAAVLLLSAALLGGCQTVNTVEKERPDAQPDYVVDKRIIHDLSLGRKCRVLDVRQGRVGSNDLLKIEVRLFNTTTSRKAFSYKFEWIDANGLTVDTPLSSWKQTTLAGKEAGSIAAVAPTPKVVDFRLKLMEPGDEPF